MCKPCSGQPWMPCANHSQCCPGHSCMRGEDKLEENNTLLFGRCKVTGPSPAPSPRPSPPPPSPPTPAPPIAKGSCIANVTTTGMSSRGATRLFLSNFKDSNKEAGGCGPALANLGLNYDTTTAFSMTSQKLVVLGQRNVVLGLCSDSSRNCSDSTVSVQREGLDFNVEQGYGGRASPTIAAYTNCDDSQNYAMWGHSFVVGYDSQKEPGSVIFSFSNGTGTSNCSSPTGHVKMTAFSGSQNTFNSQVNREMRRELHY